MPAKLFAHAPDGALPADTIQTLVQELSAGEVVAMPTETCYGLAVRADQPEALQRLVALKGRDQERTFTWHVGGPELPSPPGGWQPIPNVAQRLWRAWIPGPLTMVLPLAAEVAQNMSLQHILRQGYVGVRCPDHEATRAVLGAAPFPVVMTSANPSGEPVLVEASQVAKAFPEGLSSILDTGSSSQGGSSTVLQVGPGRFEILRQGKLALEDLQASAGLSILFVCTGNTCRSPMAEALAANRLAQGLQVPAGELVNFGFHVASCGVYAGLGSPASIESVQALEEKGIPLEGHRSTPLEQALERRVDHIYCLTRSHLAALEASLGSKSKQVYAELLDPDGNDIPDPIGGPLEFYRVTRDALERAIEARSAQWL